MIATRYVVVKLKIECFGMSPDDVVEGCDYEFKSQTSDAKIIDTEILATLDECPKGV